MTSTLARPEYAKGEWEPLQTLIGGRKPCVKPLLTINSEVRNMEGALDMHKVTVLPKREWIRITNQFTEPRARQESLQRVEDARQALHHLSKDQVNTWTNSIGGAKQRQFDSRNATVAAAEQKKAARDIELDRIKAQERRNYIDRAKTQLYYQSNRVKDFNRALNLTEIMKVRDVQIRNKKLKHELEVERSIADRKEIRQNYLNALDDEKKKRNEAKLHTIEYQRGQIAFMEKKRNQDKVNKMMEEESILADQAHYHEEERCKAEERAYDQAIHNREMARHDEGGKFMQKVFQMQIEEEDEEARIYAKAKIRMTKLGIEKDREIAGEKAKNVAVIYKHLEEILRNKASTEEAREDHAQVEVEAKKVKEEQKKEKKRLEMLQSIEEYRIQDAEYKKRVIEEEKLSDLALKRVQETADKIYFANEEKRLRHRCAENIKYSKYQLVDAEEHLRVINQERLDGYEQQRHEDEHVTLDEKQFQEYACTVMNHCEERGRNIWPMENFARRSVEGKHGPERYCGPRKRGPGYIINPPKEEKLHHIC